MRAEEVGLRYLTTAAQLRRTVDEHLADTGVSLARTKILRLLADRGPLKQAQLAAELGMAPRSITQAVETMERDGLLHRSEDTGDRRAKVVTVTDQGAAALAAGEAAGDELLRRTFRRLTPDQLAALADMLDMIAAELP